MLTFKLKRIVLIFLVIILLCFDFYQNYINQTDGDLSRVLTQVDRIRLSDFEIHGILLPYFFLINKLYWIVFDVVSSVTKNPVNSIYLTIALIKSIYIPFLFLTILNLLKLKTISVDIDFNFKLIILCVIVIYNQNFGFNRSIGVVNHSFIYFCSYALSISLLFYSITVYLIEHSISSLLLVFVFGLFGSLNPIIPFGLFISACVLICIKGDSIRLLIFRHKYFLFLSLILVIIKMLSVVYFEVENINGRQYMNLLQRYRILFTEGIGSFFCNLGFIILLIYILIQFFFRNNDKSESLSQEFKYICIVFAGYILALPMFGYKIYRPEIIKADIMTPGLMLLHYLVILFVITGFNQKTMGIRIFFINTTSILLLMIFGYKDRVISNPTMQREMYLLNSISTESNKNLSKQTCFFITEPIMYWKGMENDEALINRNNIFLRRCGVLKAGHSYCLVK